MLTVTTAASDRTLLTIEDARTAAGIADNSRDVDLNKLRARVSAVIVQACRVASDGITPPTLRKETLTQVFRQSTCSSFRIAALVLARRPLVSITSVTEDGTLLAAADYEYDAAAGLLYRLSSDVRIVWTAAKITVVFVAGWDTVPDDLTLAATKLATTFWLEGGRDPNLRKVQVEGVGLREYWVPPTTDPAIPTEVLDLLGPYMNQWIG